MSKEIKKAESKDIFSFDGGNMVENMKMAEMISSSEMVPKAYKGKPGNVMVAVQMGQEVGLKPMQALQGIAVINGTPCIWGDALIGLVRSSPLCKKITETFDCQSMTATCSAIRDGEEEKTTTFDKGDAVQAGLWDERPQITSYGKQIPNPSPWFTYPKRMLQMRARGFCLRDLFADVLKGLSVVEEIQEVQPIKQVNNAPTKSEKASKVASFLQDEPEDAEEVVESTGEVIRYSEYSDQIECCTTIEELVDLGKELGNIPECDERQGLMKEYNTKGKLLTATKKEH